jgi:hypothetical protein
MNSPNVFGSCSFVIVQYPDDQHNLSVILGVIKIFLAPGDRVIVRKKPEGAYRGTLTIFCEK